jgi:hypothetical protein
MNLRPDSEPTSTHLDGCWILLGGLEGENGEREVGIISGI